MAGGLFAIMRWLFNVPIAGHVGALLLAAFVYVFALLSLGLLISTRAENQMQALQMTVLFVLPSVFFSGFIFPRETMPWFFQTLGSLLPATYFIELSRAIILRGASLQEFASHLATLSAMAVVLFSLCALRFRNRVG
jgi:ABC-2 type transport system permease protein